MLPKPKMAAIKAMTRKTTAYVARLVLGVLSAPGGTVRVPSTVDGMACLAVGASPGCPVAWRSSRPERSAPLEAVGWPVAAAGAGAGRLADTTVPSPGVELHGETPRPRPRPGGACPAGHAASARCAWWSKPAPSSRTCTARLVGVVVHRNQHLAGVGVLADAGERLLHARRVHGECSRVGTVQPTVSRPVCHHARCCSGPSRASGFPATPSGPRLDSEDGRRFSMMRRLRAMTLLSVSAEVAGGAPALLGHLRVQPGLQAGHVQLGARSAGPSFVVQFTGDSRASSSRTCAMVGQCRQRGRALAHQAVPGGRARASSTSCSRSLARPAGHWSGAGTCKRPAARWPTVAMPRRERCSERWISYLAADGALRTALQQGAPMAADGVHVFLAHVAEQTNFQASSLPWRYSRRLNFHFRELARDLPRAAAQSRPCLQGSRLVGCAIHPGC